MRSIAPYRNALCAACCVFSASLHAARLDLSIREIERHDRAEPELLPQAFEILTAQKKPDIAFIIGAAYDRSPGGDSYANTPFILDYTGVDSPWTFELSGDGIAHARDEGTSSTGFADIAGAVKYGLPVNANVKVNFALEATVPVGGQVGSTHSDQDARVGARYKWDSWMIAGVYVLSRSGKETPGRSQYTNIYVGQVYAFFGRGNRSDVYLQIKRSQPAGSGAGKTRAALEYDFPLAKNLIGSVSAFHGFTEGARDTGGEFDVEIDF